MPGDASMLFTWLHISDLHARHGDPAYRQEQAQVMRDMLASLARRPPALERVDAIFATGDLAFSGGRRDPDEYLDVREMLGEAARQLDVASDRVFIVPGNHDVDRKVRDEASEFGAWLGEARATGVGLTSSAAPGMHRRRFARWHELTAAAMGPHGGVVADDASWHVDVEGATGLPIRIVGLNTALVSQDDADRGNLRIGWDQANRVLAAPPERLVIVLGHHPLEWLGDADALVGPMARRMDLYLHGHVHTQRNYLMLDGGGDMRVTAVAGALHLDPAERPGATPASAHAYSFGAIRATPTGLAVRMWPRRWVPQRSFINDALNCLLDLPYGELPLARTLRWSSSSAPITAPPRRPEASTNAIVAPATPYRAPLDVYVVWRAGQNHPEDLANHLFATLHRDPEDPFSYDGLNIPVYFRSVPVAGSAVPAPIDFGRAERTAVIAFLDETTLDSDAGAFRDYLRGLQATAETRAGGTEFLPIALDERTQRTVGLSATNFIRAYESDGAERIARVTNGVAHALTRLLRAPTKRDVAPAARPPIRVFVSHAKADATKAAKAVRARLERNDGLKTFFDRDDIPAGTRFASEIEYGIDAENTVMLAIVTDGSTSSQWCERETLRARQARRPMVLLDARKRQRENLPFAGFVPMVRWAPKAKEFWEELQRVVVLEALRYAYVPRYLAAVETLWHGTVEGSVHIARKPDGVDALGAAQQLVHPDPPVLREVLQLITQQRPLELATPSTMPLARRRPREVTAAATALEGRLFQGKRIALSLSDSPDRGARGYGAVHLTEVMAEFARHVIFQYGNVAYGGDLRAGGFTDDLTKLARAAARERAAADREEIVTSYLAWPTWRSFVEARARDLAPWVAFRKRPDVSGTTGIPDPTTPEGLLVWAQNMTAMRREMAEHTDGRILMGGPVAGSLSAMPGLVEESLVTLDVGKPLFLIGAFGGCAELVWDALNGRAAPALDLEVQCEARGAVRRMLPPYNAWAARVGYPEVDYAALRARLAALGVAGLNNGLTAAENEQLVYTTHVPQMIALVLLGCQRRFAIP